MQGMINLPGGHTAKLSCVSNFPSIPPMFCALSMYLVSYPQQTTIDLYFVLYFIIVYKEPQ